MAKMVYPCFEFRFNFDDKSLHLQGYGNWAGKGTLVPIAFKVAVKEKIGRFLEIIKPGLTPS